MADASNAGIRPILLRRRSRESDHIQRQRNLTDDPLDLTRIRQSRNEEAARARIGESLAPFDHAVDQRIVVGLRLKERIRPRVDEEGVANRVARSH